MFLSHKVQFYSRHMFKSILLSHEDDPIENDLAIISVNDTVDEAREMQSMLEDHSNHLIMVFPDNNNPLSTDEAKKILSFINDNKERTFLVHCWAGISRSAAIAKFINEYMEADDVILNHYNMHNRAVLSALEAAAGTSLASHYEELELQDRLNPKEIEK